MKTKNFLRIIVIFLSILSAFLIKSLYAQDWTITRLTNNNYDDYSPQIHNGQVVWERYDGNDMVEIYFYDGSSTIQLTNNSYNDFFPQIHNGQVVWHGDVNGIGGMRYSSMMAPALPS